MSRCFPYPPPGYTPSRASKEALIESIKLQKEQEKAKAQKQTKKRREKEDERKGREDERNEIRKKTNEKTDLNSKKRRKREERREEKKGRRKESIEKPDLNSNKFSFPNRQIGKNIWAHGEQLQRSGLTEEHDQPIRYLPSKSSESTENSSKWKRPSSPVNVIRGHGTIIRILLSSKKRNLPDISINEQQIYSTSGRTDVPPQRNLQPNFCASAEKTSDFVQGDFNRTDKKHIISTSGKSEPAGPAKTRTPPGLDAIEGSKESSESLQFKNLIENWVPPSLQDTPFSPEDLDWLICSKDHGLRPERRQKFENDTVFCSISSSLWQPRAQLSPLPRHATPIHVRI
ncbi:uncharacterized protein LOC142532504 [Primulina tabacum]|uniref:uncharacterized protein LOC142532504 n=1 Tax=Primulina tabacum TaxID=48773 RepID=UPI003F5A4695